MSDGIKDYILPEFITDKVVCKEELQKVQDNIEYLEKLRLQFLKKYAELTNQKVFMEQIDCRCTYDSYHVARNKKDCSVDTEFYGELDIIDDVIEQNFIEEIE